MTNINLLWFCLFVSWLCIASLALALWKALNSINILFDAVKCLLTGQKASLEYTRTISRFVGLTNDSPKPKQRTN